MLGPSSSPRYSLLNFISFNIWSFWSNIIIITSIITTNYSIFLKLPNANYEPGQGSIIALWSTPFSQVLPATFLNPDDRAYVPPAEHVWGGSLTICLNLLNGIHAYRLSWFFWSRWKPTSHSQSSSVHVQFFFCFTRGVSSPILHWWSTFLRAYWIWRPSMHPVSLSAAG